MMLTGYPVEDLALRASFVEASIAAVHDVAERLRVDGLGGITVVTGYLDRRTDLAPRTGLPAGARLDADGGPVDVAVAICEDLWQDGGPVAVTRRAGAGLLVVPNASPYERGKDDVRLELCVRRAREAGAALAYCNMIGGQDELVFDGDSILVSASGELLARGPQFEEALIVADLDLPPAADGDVPAGAAV